MMLANALVQSSQRFISIKVNTFAVHIYAKLQKLKNGHKIIKLANSTAYFTRNNNL